MELVSMTRYLTKSALPPVLIRRQHLWFVLAGPVSLTRCCVRDLTQRARRQAAGLVAAPRRQRPASARPPAVAGFCVLLSHLSSLGRAVSPTRCSLCWSPRPAAVLPPPHS